jgi:DNA repair exonuclease SbcCD nuclease subunit
MDYLALGHWHSFRQDRFGGVVACYPGSPEFVSVDQRGAGQVALVTIGRDGTVSVEPRQVGVRRLDELEVALDTLNSPAQVAEAIRAKADPNLVLQVTLTGLCAFDFEIDLEKLAEELESDFFHLRLRDKSHPRLDDVAIAELPETTVAGKFARIMRERIEKVEEAAASGDGNAADEKVVYEEALKLGVALLEGKQVLG